MNQCIGVALPSDNLALSVSVCGSQAWLVICEVTGLFANKRGDPSYRLTVLSVAIPHRHRRDQVVDTSSGKGIGNVRNPDKPYSSPRGFRTESGA